MAKTASGSVELQKGTLKGDFELTENSVSSQPRASDDPRASEEIRRRYGLSREAISDSTVFLAKINTDTCSDIMPRPERLTPFPDLQTDDPGAPEERRSALYVSIAEAREVLVPVEVDEMYNLLDGFRRLYIARQLGLKSVPVVILMGWRGNPAQIDALKRAYVHEVNLTARFLDLADKEKIARQILKEDERKFRTAELEHRLSYGAVAARSGLSQHTVERIEQQEFYLRYRDRCQGEQRLRGDGRLRATLPAPPGQRLDEREAWSRGLGGITPRRSTSGLRQAIEERRKTLTCLAEGLEREEKEALLEDALALLEPRMAALDEERGKDKERRKEEEEKRAEETAKREAESALERKRRYVQDFLPDVFIVPPEGAARGVPVATFLDSDREVEHVLMVLAKSGRVAYRSAVSLDDQSQLHYEQEELSEEAFRRLVQEAREGEIIVAGDATCPVRALADAKQLRSMLDLSEAGEEMFLEARVDERTVARQFADGEVLLHLHRDLNRSVEIGHSAAQEDDADAGFGEGEVGTSAQTEIDSGETCGAYESPGVGGGSAPERPDTRIASPKEPKKRQDRSVALQRFTAACAHLSEVSGLLSGVEWQAEPVDEWARLGQGATASLREIWRAMPDSAHRDWPEGF